jgi:cytochrome c peroxidase
MDCHIPPLTFTSHDVFDVGLPDENKLAKFNPPSLRGVGQGQSFLHDARATRLEDVFDVYGHQLRGELADADRADLLRFLRGL